MSEREDKEQREPQKAGRLCDFVQQEREDILREWEARTRAILAIAERLGDASLRDHLPKLLAWIGDVVRTAHEGVARTPGVLPDLHAQARMADGYDLIEVARELSLLRQVILELWDARCGPTVLVKEVLRLNEAIDMLVARSARAFADAQQREIRARLDTERQMIGVVAHDLRTPLSTIAMSAEGLLRLPLDNRTLRGTVRIRNAAQRAVRLTADLLDFAQARLGTGIPVARTPANLHAIARGVVEEERALATHRDLLHEEEGDGSAELDPDRIAQTVHNLLSNALKYSTPESEITVRTRGEPDAVVLTVHNWGAPIPAETLPRLFEPLRRGPDRRHANGVGLGLYIVQSIVQAHSGTVTVTSTENEGTMFTVRIPRTGGLVPLATSSTGDRSGTSRAQARGVWGGATWEQTSSARAKPPRSGAEVRQDSWRAGLERTFRGRGGGLGRGVGEAVVAELGDAG